MFFNILFMKNNFKILTQIKIYNSKIMLDRLLIF